MSAVWTWILSSIIYPIGKLIFQDFVNFIAAFFKEKKKVSDQNIKSDRAAQAYQKVEDDPNSTKQEKIDAETTLLGGG